MRGWLSRALLGAIALFLVTVLAVVTAAETMERRHAHGRSLERAVDAAVVLGAGVDPDRVLQYPSRRRVAVAVELLELGKARSLIISGAAVRGADASVAELMRDYAVSLGAPRKAVLVENAAGSTFENLRFSFEIARRAGHDRLAVVTDDWHLLRAAWLACYFEECGIGLVAAPTDSVVEWGWVVREALAWWYNAAKVTAWSALDAAGVPEETRALIVG